MAATAAARVLVPEGNGPRFGSAGHAMLSLIHGNVPAVLEIPNLRPDDIACAHDGLARFDVESPRELQKLWGFHVPRDPEYDEPDDGAIRKAEIDWKLFFHFRPDLRDLLAARGITLTPWQEEWFAACKRIWDACSAMSDELTVKLDMARPGFDFAKRSALYRDQNVLRLLRYEPRAGMLAQEHADRCALTFHIAESCDGLYSIDGWERRSHHTPNTPEVLCFSGEQLERASNGRMPRMWHGVRDTTAGTEPRWAMVFFGKMFPKRLLSA